MKRLICWAIVLVMLLTALPAMADNTRTSGLYTYEIKGNGTITITGFDWEANGNADIYIPNLIDGYIVTAIGDEAFKCEQRGKGGCSLTLPDTITAIGKKAFWKASLWRINLPDNLQNIGYGAFVGNNCEFVISGKHNYFAVIDCVLYNKVKKELLFCPSTSSDISIPEGIISIGDYAFYRDEEKWYDAVGKVQLPSTIQHIGNFAFYGFQFDYGSSFMPESLQTIGESAFEKSGFMDGSFKGFAFIPTTVTSIGKAAFRESNWWNEIVLAEGCVLSTFEEETFKDCKAQICIDTKNIHSVAPYAFYQSGGAADNVKWEYLDSIDNWGEYAFTDTFGNTVFDEDTCAKAKLSSKLTKLPAGFELICNLPDTVTSISSHAYNGIVTDYRLSSALIDIAADAFPRGSTFVVDAGSYAELWCKENGFGYTIEGQEDDLSWLNN